MSDESHKDSRPATTAEALGTLKARLSEHLSPAEIREIDAAISKAARYDFVIENMRPFVQCDPFTESFVMGFGTAVQVPIRWERGPERYHGASTPEPSLDECFNAVMTRSDK